MRTHAILACLLLVATELPAQQPSGSSTAPADPSALENQPNTPVVREPHQKPVHAAPAPTDDMDQGPGAVPEAGAGPASQGASASPGTAGSAMAGQPALEDLGSGSADAEAQPLDPSRESSSRQTAVDISPPPGDPGRVGPGTTVGELTTYDPHKAQKDVEVGDFYFKRGNYRAALSRYAEALEYKPHDATATYALASAEERMGMTAEARQHYQEYLHMLPDGPRSQDAQRALTRLSAGNEGSR